LLLWYHIKTAFVNQKHGKLSPAVQKFREHLVEEAQKLPGNLVENP